jgi:hypothetical protein
MPLYTGKEYQEKKSKKRPKHLGKKNSVLASPDGGAIIQDDGFEYVFVHPDNSKDNPINHTFKLKVNDELKNIQVNDGVIKVYNETYKNALIKAGYLFHIKRKKQ